MVGDGYCNTETNNIHCAFDRDDCCYGDLLITEYCNRNMVEKCQCLTGETIDDKHQPIIGNGYCNEIANIPDYNYDNGDCCGTCVIDDCKNSTLNCTCKDDSYGVGVINPLLGNGICNDDTNNDVCNHDFGDCCPKLELVGNGVCNDETNYLECNFDGGDCCLTNVNKDHCSECKCASKGIITSPGYPKHYAKNMQSFWLIEFPLGLYIRITFSVLDIGLDFSKKDYLNALYVETLYGW